MSEKAMIIITLTLIISFGCARREPKPNDVQQNASNPQYAAELICYIGKMGSGSKCSGIIFDPNKFKNESIRVSNQSLKCGRPGQVSDIS